MSLQYDMWKCQRGHRVSFGDARESQSVSNPRPPSLRFYLIGNKHSLGDSPS